MKEYFIKVNNNRLITNLEGAVENDHDSMVVNCDIDVEASSYLFKLLYPDNTKWVKNIVDNKIILPQLSKMGNYQYEISMYKDNGRLTTLAKGSFFTRKELVNVDEEVEHDDRVPVLDQLISETNNLDVNAERVTNGVEIEVTKKDGSVKKVVVQDGAKGEQGIQGIKGDKGDKGDQGIQGIQGVKGDTGEKGPKGDKGDRGETGPKGDTGATGPQGPQGPAGEGGVSLEEVKQITGELENLSTEDKTNLVNAINEIASSSGSSGFDIINYGNVTQSNPFKFENKKKGIYRITPDSWQYVIYDSNFETYSYSKNIYLIFVAKDYDENDPNNTFLGFSLATSTNGYISMTTYKKSSSTRTGLNTEEFYKGTFVGLEGVQTINGTKTFNSMPKCSVVPTADEHLVNKKYVDDSIASAITTTLGGSY